MDSETEHGYQEIDAGYCRGTHPVRRALTAKYYGIFNISLEMRHGVSVTASESSNSLSRIILLTIIK
jgi:hypothetical protein